MMPEKKKQRKQTTKAKSANPKKTAKRVKKVSTTVAKKTIRKSGPKKSQKKIVANDTVIARDVRSETELNESNLELNRPVEELVREEIVPTPEIETDHNNTSSNPIAPSGINFEVEIDPEADLNSDADFKNDRELADSSGEIQSKNDEVKVSQQSGDVEIQLVCFSIEGEVFGFEINLVREIIRMVEITGLPECPAHSLGIINLRGKVVDVYDLRICLGYPPKEPGSETRIIVLDYKERLIGLVVDAVTQVLRINSFEIESTPAITNAVDRKFLRGISRQEERLILLLEPHSLIE